MMTDSEPISCGRLTGPNSTATLLCFGNDEALLSYRIQVLTQAGFSVVGARPHAQQAGEFVGLCRLHGPAVIIACHTLTRQQRTAIAQELRDDCPHVRLIALTNDSLSPDESAGYDLLLDSLDGPAALIREVRSHIGSGSRCCNNPS